MRKDEAPPLSSIALPGFTFEPAQVELLTAAGDRVSLRPRAREVLRHLAHKAGQVVSKDELIRAVWPGVIVTDDSLVQCIAELRRVLNDDERRVIVTEPRRGYRLVPLEIAATNGPLAEGSATAGFQQNIRFATTADGVRIAYATSGTGSPLVRAAHWMTHLDWDWRSATFGPRIQALAQRFCLVRYDGRGYGLSDWEAEPATLDEAVADLESVVEAAGLDRFSLLGASGGAAIAIRYAARHAQKVNRLVLLGGFARGMLRRGERSISRGNFEAMLRLLEDGWGQDNPAFRQLITSMMWPGADVQQMASFNQLQRVSCAPHTASGLLRRIAEFDVTEDLPNVRCPTLVLHSPRDSRVPFEEGRLMASMIPGARLEPFDSANHTPLVGEPAFAHVRRLMEEFIDHAAQNAEPQAPRVVNPPALRVVGEGGAGATPVNATRKR